MSDKASISYPVTVDIVGSNIPIPSVIAEDPLFQQPARSLWTRETVGILIKKRFGLALSVWRVGRSLRRWGLTPQKPARRAYEQDPAAVRRWLGKEYPDIRKQAKTEGAEIH